MGQSRGAWVETGEYGRKRRRGLGPLGDRSLEDRTACGKLIEIRRGSPGVPEVAEMIGAERIDRDEENPPGNRQSFRRSSTPQDAEKEKRDPTEQASPVHGRSSNNRSL